MKTETPITEQHLAAALVQLSILKFFPMDELQHRAMTEYLRRLCGHAEGLAWLVAQLVNHVGEWPGSADVRGIYCTRFKPADGIENLNCRLSGFTPTDCETKEVQGQIGKAEAQKLLGSLR